MEFLKEETAMKNIILVRHATAVKRDPEKSDVKRSLKKSGHKEAREMGKRLKEMDIHSDLFISSPAKRAIETAEIVAERLGYSVKKIEKIEELYRELPPKGFLELIRSLDDKVDSAIFFGHDPAFTDFARFLISGFDSDLPKAGVLGVEVDVAVWADVKPELARKAYFFYPGDTAVAKEREGRCARELGTKIERSSASAVADFGIVGGKDLTEKLRRVSTKLAKQLAPRAKAVRR